MNPQTPEEEVERFTAGRLAVEVHDSRRWLGRAAGMEAAQHLRALLARQPGARVIFACAPSQDEFLAHLTAETGIAWPRVTVFHMDEYVGLPAAHPASFRHYLRTHLTAKVRPGVVHELAGDATDEAGECARYGALLAEAPVDMVCLGIGENGHLAFNDPPVAQFNDPARVKSVELDLACREQQVHDRCFPSLAEVPRRALTLTIPSLLKSTRMFCIVPGPRKAAAVKATLRGPVTPSCPASILRIHPAATLFLDNESAALLPV
jgi:glucosamine-6-phosphate deaminase